MIVYGYITSEHKYITQKLTAQVKTAISKINNDNDIDHTPKYCTDTIISINKS